MNFKYGKSKQKFTEEETEKRVEELSKKVVIGDDLRLHELDSHIFRCKTKKFILMIRHA